MSHVLTYEELFKIGFGTKTTRRYHISKDGSVHVLRLSAEWKGTPHGDMSLWLINAASLDDVDSIWLDIKKEGERTNGRIAFYDLGDATELPLVLEVLMLSDGKLCFDAYEYCYQKDRPGFLGFIIGNGLKIDLATEGMPGLIACILANHLGPKNEFLADACERVDKVLVELKKIGVKVTGLKAEGAA